MKILKETFNQYKWTLLAGIIVAVMIALITANFHVLQFMNYKMHNNVTGVLSVLQSQVKHEKAQDDWFFAQGMKYLLNQEEYSEELENFFEEQFGTFTKEWKKGIIEVYSKKNLKLATSKDVMEVLLEYIDDTNIRSYITKLEVSELEQGLTLVYGNNPKVNDEFVDTLYKLLSIYPEKLTFNKFEFNLYEVLNYKGEAAEEKIRYIFSKVEPAVAKENIFKQLRNEELTEEKLCEWVEFFNGTGMITPNEYAKFNELYGSICLIRNQYNALDTEEVQLKNKIAEVDAKIGDKVKVLEAKKAEMAPVETQISELEASLESLINYSYMPLYIEKVSGTGSNEYIASSPRGGLFGMRPSGLKYIVKLNATSFVKEGVYNLNLYYKGTKNAADGVEYGYYVEVSDSDIASIDSMKAERAAKIEALNQMKQEVSQIETEVNTIRSENQYDETKESLENLEGRRTEYANKINEEVIKIRQLFGLSNIKIDLRVTK